jgi:hypothetical protein
MVRIQGFLRSESCSSTFLEQCTYTHSSTGSLQRMELGKGEKEHNIRSTQKLLQETEASPQDTG